MAKDILSKQVKRKGQIKALGENFPEVRIMDATEFKLPKQAADKFPGYGGKGREAIAKIQYEFDLLSGNIKEMTIGSALNSDSLEGMKNIDMIPKGSLLIRDLAYFSPKAFKILDSKGLFFLNRAKSQWNFYTKTENEYKLLTTSDIIKRLKKQKYKYIDLDVYVGLESKTPVRLIANLLTKEQTTERFKKKSSVRKLGKDTLEAIGLNLFVTNVKREICDAASVYELYRLRWQIELIFKVWKSNLNLHKVHNMNKIRIECMFWVKLIGVLLNWSIYLIFQNRSTIELSFHKVSRAIIRVLKIDILKSPALMKKWMEEMINSHLKSFEKEYKKGSKSTDLYHLTFC